MSKALLLSFLLCFALNSHSQNLIKGNVTDSLQGPVPYCAMTLMSAKDSSLIKGNITDSLGFYSFENVKPGMYFIKFNSVGFRPSTTDSFKVDSLSQMTLPGQVLKTE